MQDLITSATLKQLAEAGSIDRAVVSPVPHGFAVSVSVGSSRPMVQAKRGHLRTWKTIDAAARTLRLLGLKSIEIDLSTFDANTPETSEAGDTTGNARRRVLNGESQSIYGGATHD